MSAGGTHEGHGGARLDLEVEAIQDLLRGSGGVGEVHVPAREIYRQRERERERERSML